MHRSGRARDNAENVQGLAEETLAEEEEEERSGEQRKVGDRMLELGLKTTQWQESGSAAVGGRSDAALRCDVAGAERSFPQSTAGADNAPNLHRDRKVPGRREQGRKGENDWSG